MPRKLQWPAIPVAILLFAHAAAAGRDPEAPDQNDQQLLGELAEKSIEAAALFQEANQLRAKEPAEAARRYAQVEKLVPGFAPAFRRHAGCELRQRHDAEALPLAQKAYLLDHAPENQSTLAMALLVNPPTDEDRKMELGGESWALTLAREGALGQPEDEFAQVVYCQASVVAGRPDELRKAVERLRLLEPESASTWWFQAALDAFEERMNDALESLEQARARGYDPKRCDETRARLLAARPWWQAALGPALRIGAAWLLAMIGLFAVGLVLSAITLRASRRPPERSEHPGRAEALLRRTYAAVIWLCSVYYWVSLPIVLAVVVGVGGGVMYAIGTHLRGGGALKLLFLVGACVLVTTGSVLRSLFVRTRDEDPGKRLDLARQPWLKGLLDGVAARIGTRSVDAVYLTPGAEMAVFERGGLLARLRGRSQRCLVVGVAALRGCPVPALRSVLGHELGHFVNRDTAGGGLALMVRSSMQTFIIGLLRGGAARAYNPAWWFVQAYWRVFLRLSHGASRLQEALADRWSATAYGTQAFEEGMRHMIGAAVRFDAHVNAVVREARDRGRGLRNLYRFVCEAPPPVGDVDKAIEESLARPASPYDSHPPPRDRIAWVRALGIVAPVADDDPDAWAHIVDREALEREMTEEVRTNLRERYRLHLPVEDRPPGQAA